jgi:hypothetical protein
MPGGEEGATKKAKRKERKTTRNQIKRGYLQGETANFS